MVVGFRFTGFIKMYYTISISKKLKMFRLICACVCGLLIQIAHAETEVLEFDQQWIREMPPGMPTMAAYMHITNTGSAPVTIKSASSNVSNSVELHEVRIDDELMQMRELTELVIDTGQSIELKPGGIHLMLVGVEQSLKQGDQVEINFELSDSQNVKIILPVKKEL